MENVVGLDKFTRDLCQLNAYLSASIVKELIGRHIGTMHYQRTYELFWTNCPALSNHLKSISPKVRPKEWEQYKVDAKEVEAQAWEFMDWWCKENNYLTTDLIADLYRGTELEGLICL